MAWISPKRLEAVEPITAIVGMTEEGDLLIEDRNGVRYGMRRALLDADPFPAMVQDEQHAQELVEIIEEASAPPEPKPKRSRKK